ncbi:MAG: hypothetical protein HQM11_07495 [SAR324 cluster bacterium]|nr:hypothetical protein [SAR324 cluster bacterium]
MPQISVPVWKIIFKDQYVRYGALAGVLAGLFFQQFVILPLFLDPDYLWINQALTVCGMGMIGWGTGVYTGYYKPGKRPHLKVYR